MVDKYTTVEMSLDGEVRYPSDYDFENSWDNLKAFSTHAQTALLNYQPDGQLI